MTRMQFDRLRAGITYEQCVRFVGSQGKRGSSAGPGDEEYVWQMADASGEATLRFRNGALYGKGFNSSRGQRGSAEAILSSGLGNDRPATPPYICRSVYDTLRTGLSYADCARLLGQEGRYLGRRTISAGRYSPNGTLIPSTVDVFAWHNATIPATLTLSFLDGKLTSREISTGSAAR